MAHECHEVWEYFLNPEHRHPASNLLEKTDLSERIAHQIKSYFYAYFGTHDFIEKTPRNTLRIPFLKELFPQAKFIFLFRQGEDNINSLINGWRAPNKFKPYKNQFQIKTKDYGTLDWSFALVPEWQKLHGKSLAEICAYQWLTCNQSMLDYQNIIPENQKYIIPYEKFIAQPHEILKACFEHLHIEYKPNFISNHITLKPVNYTSQPSKNKWKNENKAAIESIQTLIQPMNQKLGYTI